MDLIICDDQNLDKSVNSAKGMLHWKGKEERDVKV